MEQCVHDCLKGWQAKTLSFMGRTTTIRSVLSSILIFLLANMIMPSSYLRGLVQLFQNFLLSSRHNHRRLYRVSWEMVYQSMRDGDLRIQSLLVKKEELNAKHIVRYLFQLDCLWSRVMRAWYEAWSQGSQIQTAQGCSFIWKEICTCGPTMSTQVRWLIRDGTLVDIS